MGLTVVVVLVVLAVIAVVALLAAQSRRRRQEQQRIEAAEHRHEAEIRSASAQRREAEASERAARAEHEQAQAREQAARARQDREAAEARQAAADRIDPDRPTPDRGQETDADPAARTDDLRLGTDRPGAGPHARAEQAAPGEGSRQAAPSASHAAGTAPDRPWDGAKAGHGGAGRHEATTPPRGDDPGQGTDPAARTDDLRLGEGRREAAQQDAAGPHLQTGGGWHGPSASGGFPAADPSARDTGPADSVTSPGAPRHAEGRPAPGASEAGRTSPGSPEGPSASGPAVPSQRTGEHDDAQRDPAADEHGGPVRALADRLLRRRG